MLQLPTLYFLLSSSILAITHVLALELFLYWRYWWLDIPVHFLGGIVAGLGLYVLRDLRVLDRSFSISLIKVLACVFVVAVAWEVFEYSIGYPVIEFFWSDTLIDLAMGLLGGLVAYTVASSSSKMESL